jgi:hypothetical protein
VQRYQNQRYQTKSSLNTIEESGKPREITAHFIFVPALRIQREQGSKKEANDPLEPQQAVMVFEDGK